MAGELTHIIPTHPSDTAYRARQTRQIVYVDPNGTQHDIIAVYWSDSNAQSHLIWQKQKEYRFVDCTGSNNEQPSFILRINKSCELNSITVYMSLNNTKHYNVTLAQCIDLNDENIDITEETNFFRNTKVIANNSNFTISSELCDFKTVNNEDVYKITFTLNNLIISTGLYYFTFSVSTDNNTYDRKICYSNSATVARNFLYNNISDTVNYPMWTQTYNMASNSDNIKNGYVDYSISSSDLNWGDVNQPFASSFAEFELYDDINKKLMWNMYAYYPVSQGTAGTKLNVNDCVKSYDVWPDRIRTNYLYLSAHSVYSANGESMFSTQVLANNDEMTPARVGSFPYPYDEPDDQTFLHCIDTYNYTRNYVNDSNVVSFILYTPTTNCKLSSVSYFNGDSNAETPVVNVGVVELDSSMKGVSNLGTFTDDHIIKYKYTSVTTENNTVDMILYKHYRKPVNDILLEANKTYAISISDDTQNRQYQFYRTNVANGTLANDNRHYPVVALNPWSYGNTTVSSLNCSAYVIITTANN